MAMPSAAKEDPQAFLRKMDEAGATSLQWKVLLTAGMGFFTDAYDLFIRGAVMRLIKPEWQPRILERALFTSTACRFAV
jgi:MFS transporter, PHS family, inorganic phosphate transporter